ncbi:dihydrofolate reductase family protein [Nonomuraea ferruginea]
MALPVLERRDGRRGPGGPAEPGGDADGPQAVRGVVGLLDHDRPGPGDRRAFQRRPPKYVVSSTLEKADWNNTTVIGGDVAAGLRELKERLDGDIQMSGSATTVRWLLANGLLDELKLLVHPIVVGRGQRLFEDTPTHPLKLVESQTFQTGVLNLTYVPDTD